MKTIRQFWSLLAIALMAGVAAGRAAAQESSGNGSGSKDTMEAHVHAVQRARQGAGLRVGMWESPAPAPTGTQVSSTPAFEGYWQKGLDRHLVLETGIGVWARNVNDPASGNRDAIYLVPMTTALKMFPFTGPEANLEPFLTGGAGFTLGIDDQTTGGSGGLLGTPGSNQTLMTFGFTLRGSGGLEWHMSRAFGLQAGVGYQYTKMFEDIAGGRDFKGLQVGAGLTYRFQF